MKTEFFQPQGKITVATEVVKNLNETVKKEYNGILAGGNSLCSFSYKSQLKKPETTRKWKMGGGQTDLDSVVVGHTAAQHPVLLLHTLTPSPLMRKGQGLKERERSTDEKTICCSTITQTHTLIPFISIYNSCVKCPQFAKHLTGAVVAAATVR